MREMSHRLAVDLTKWSIKQKACKLGVEDSDPVSEARYCRRLGLM